MIKLKLRVFLVLILANFYSVNCKYESRNCPDPAQRNAGNFFKTGPNSKYLYNPEATPESFDKIEQICLGMGLEMAEIQSAADLNHLANFTIEQKVVGRNWALGITDAEKEGFFTEQGGTPMRYQAFWQNQPDNGDGESNCIELTYANNGEDFAMFDVPCSKPAFPLCQFTKSDGCNLNSPMSVLAHKSEGIDLIGYTGTRKYFASSMQKTWPEALVYCARQNKNLADFSEAAGSEIESVFKIAQNFLNSHGLNEFYGFWTSGKYEYQVDGEAFVWKTTDVSFENQNLSRTFLDWLPGEPMDNIGANLETCIAYYAPNPFGRKSGSPVPLLAAVNCRIPLYFMCYETIGTKEAEYLTQVMPQLEFDDSNPNVETEKEPCFADGSKAPVFTLTKPGLSTKETVDFALFSMNNHLQSDVVTLKVKQEIQWRLPIIDTFLEITKLMCPHEVVDNGFLNVMKNLILIYYQSFNYDGTKVDKGKWKNITAELSACSKKLKPLAFQTSASSIVGFADGNSSESNYIGPIEDIFDMAHTPDLVIDTLWHMFSLSAGACVHNVNGRSKTDWMSEFFLVFTKDFLEKLSKRWLDGGNIDYGALIGDVDVGSNFWNLKVCSSAIYGSNDITSMQFARPVFFDNGHPNTKTGDPLVRVDINFKNGR